MNIIFEVNCVSDSVIMHSKSTFRAINIKLPAEEINFPLPPTALLPPPKKIPKVISIIYDK